MLSTAMQLVVRHSTSTVFPPVRTSRAICTVRPLHPFSTVMGRVATAAANDAASASGSAPGSASGSSSSSSSPPPSSSSPSSPPALIIYTKETCPLCDGLKDKVQAILDRAPFTGSVLNGFKIQARDVMSNPEWESRYSMEVPVLAVVRPDGSEHVVPRQSPRAPVDRLEKVILETLHV